MIITCLCRRDRFLQGISVRQMQCDISFFFFFFPSSQSPISHVVVKRCERLLSASTHQICAAAGTKDPLLSAQSFLLLMCVIVPARECLSYTLWLRAAQPADLLLPSCSPIVAPSFPTTGCGGDHLWRPQWEEVGTVLRWAWNKGLQTSGAALLTSTQRRQKIVFKTKNITIRFNLGLTVSI